MASPEKRTEWLVGLFLFIGLVLLGGLILQFGRFKDYLGGHYTITVVFDDASGLIKGSEVRMSGARIGQVAKLPALNDAVQVEVKLVINEGVRIPADSSFQIDSATLLGDKLIVIVPPEAKNGIYIEPGSRQPGAGPAGLGALQNNAELLARDVRHLVKRAETSLDKVDAAVVEIQSAAGKVNRSVLADANLARFDQTLTRLADVSGQWTVTSRKLDPTLDDARAAIESIKAAAETAEKTLKTADETIAGIRPALKSVPAAADRIARTAEKAGDALDRMENGEGMLGAFASDNDVSLDFKAFMRNLRHYGILRYRNAAPNADEQPKASEEPNEKSRLAAPGRIKGRPN